MDFPLVSIIITVYNYAHTVATAIESALVQDYPNLEVVVMDNASTDDTPAVVARYTDDPRLRYIRNAENIGLTPNHNEGLRQSRGTFVTFLSADDWLMPTFVSHSYRYLQDHPAIDVLYTGVYFADLEGRLTTFRHMSGEPFAPYSGGRNEFGELLAEGCYICFPSMLMNRELLEKYGDLDTTVKAADYELVIRWAKNGVRFAYDPDPLCVVRLHATQSSGQMNFLENGGMLREHLYIFQKYIVPETEERLDGSEMAIDRQLAGLESYTGQLGFPVDEDLHRDIEIMRGKLNTVKMRNRRRRIPAFVTIGLLARGPLSLIELTLRSLAEQDDDRFEVQVIYPPGPSPWPLAEYIAKGRRFCNVPLTTMLGDATTFNLSKRIGAGNAFTFVRSGSTFEAGHVGRMCKAFDEHDSDIVLTPARVSIERFLTAGSRENVELRDDVYGFPSVHALNIAPALPLESIAFRKRAADGAGNFNDAMSVLAHWDFFLRMSAQSSIVAQSHPVTVRAFVGYADPLMQLPQIADIIQEVHDRLPTADPGVAELRARFVKEVRRAIETGLPQAGDADSLRHQLAVIAGTGTIAKAASV